MLEKFFQTKNDVHAGFVRESSAFDEADDGELKIHVDEKTNRVEVVFEEDNADEVAAYIEEPSKNTGPRTIMVRKKADIDEKTGKPKASFMSALDVLYETLRYPLFFTRGEPGWGLGNAKEKSKTLLRHLRQMILREPRFRQLHALGQQYIVDQYSRIEDIRLFFGADQAKKSKELAYGSLEFDAQDEDEDPWKGVDVPDSFVKSDGWFRAKLADSMTLLARFGKPDFFVTVTTNPMWPEIRRFTKNATQDPVLTCQIFEAKLQRLLKHLRSRDSVLGRPAYTVGVIEFQKRGLPHAHLLLYAEDRAGKDFTAKPADVDNFVCTEISETKTTWGRKLVDSNMVHRCGPFCFTKKHNCAGKTEICQELCDLCRKRFPHDFCEKTKLDPEKGHVIHRRREPEDRLCVEFNETLLRMWDGHCNVKVASTAQIIAYLFAYTFKGNDKAEYILQLEETGSPLKAYRKARYLTSMEAVWRALSYQNVWIEPSVHTLNVTIPFVVGGQLEAHRKKIAKTKNMTKSIERGTLDPVQAWFYRPQHLKNLTPQEYFESYGLSSEPFAKIEKLKEGKDYWRDQRPGKPWYVRKHPRGKQIWRFFNLHPYHGASFYLMLLLKHGLAKPILNNSQKPLDGFRACLEMNSATYDTYEEAVRTEIPHLLGDEGPLLYFRELIANQESPSRLRWSFVLLIEHCSWGHSQFEEFKDALSQDFVLRGWKPEKAREAALADLQRRLRKIGKSLKDFGFAIQIDQQQEARLLGEDSRSELFVDCAEPEELRPEDQKPMHDTLLEAFERNRKAVPGDHLYNISAKAGAGKTFTINALLKSAWCAGLNVIACASSGIAAGELAGGTTAHKALGLPFDENNEEQLTIAMSPGTKLYREIEAAHGIIIDEAYMLDARYYYALDEFLRGMAAKSANNAVQSLASLPFGGKVIALIGDFQQLPPVVKSAGNAIAKTIERSFKSTPFWEQTSALRLHKSERLKADPEFAKWLECVARDGGSTLERIPGGANILFPEYITHEDDQEKGLEWLGGDYLKTLKKTEFDIKNNDHIDAAVGLAKCAYVCSINETCNRINKEITDHLAGDVVELHSDNTVTCDGEKFSCGHFSSSDFMETIHDGSRPPGVLRIKPGSVVFIMQNLMRDLPRYTKCVVLSISEKRGAVRLVKVKNLEDHVDWVESDGTKGRRLNLFNDAFSIPRTIHEIKHQHLTIQRTQFPISPA